MKTKRIVTIGAVLALVVVAASVTLIAVREGKSTSTGPQILPGTDVAEPEAPAEQTATWEQLIASIPLGNPEAALDLANKWRDSQPDVLTTLTSDAIVFSFLDGRHIEAVLPADEMVVSIAPYVTYTHPCSVHSIVGCSGELERHPFDYEVVSATGRVVQAGTVRTGSNGFFELWLPRDQTFTVTVRSERGSAVREISTNLNDPTCITDMKLEA